MTVKILFQSSKSPIISISWDNYNTENTKIFNKDLLNGKIDFYIQI